MDYMPPLMESESPLDASLFHFPTPPQTMPAPALVRQLAVLEQQKQQRIQQEKEHERRVAEARAVAKGKREDALARLEMTQRNEMGQDAEAPLAKSAKANAEPSTSTDRYAFPLQAL